jgi:phenylacetate-CoA ligase
MPRSLVGKRACLLRSAPQAAMASAQWAPMLRSRALMGTGTFKSILPDAIWPAIAGPRAASLLALQYQLEQSEWLPPEELKQNQFRQLQGVIQHAGASVPYYSKRFMESGIDTNAPLDDAKWNNIPLLTRVDIQQAADTLISTAIPKTHGKMTSISTSGSTGMPVTIKGTGLTQLFWLALTLRDHLWSGMDPAKKFAAVRFMKKGGAEFPGERHNGWGGATDPVFVTGPSFVLNIMTPVEKQIEWLQQNSPDYLLTYPSNLMALMTHCRDNDVTIPPLQLIGTFGEILFPEIRDAAKDTWGVRIADMYSTNEVGYVALQCPEHEHYHVQSENLLVEVLDEKGHPCSQEKTGRVVVTTLHNFAMPLIRYVLGDYATVGKLCPCGRGLPVLTRITGRVRNMMTLPSGGRVWPSFGASKIGDVVPIRQFQLVQKTLTELELRVVPQRPFTSDDEEKMRALITKQLGGGFQVAFTYHDAIARGAGGKYEDFRSELPA